MRTRYRNIMIACLFCLPLFVPFQKSPLYALEKTENVLGWSYKLENGIEKSIRSYLLVNNPENADQKQFFITSTCHLPIGQEGVYGQCKHNINILSTGSKFAVDTGEDVVRIRTSWNTPIVLGTIDYGCCVEPLVVTFYRDDGQRIGKLKKSHRERFSLHGNVITRSLDLRNSTGLHDKVQYFVIQDYQKDDIFYAVKKVKNAKLSTIPISYKNSDQAKCKEWFLGEFVKYSDRNDITLSLEGFYCNNRTKEGYEKKLYSCFDQDNTIECKER